MSAAEDLLQQISQRFDDQIERLAVLSSPDAIWSVEDIAHYLRLSTSTVHSRTITQNSFPKAFIIPSKGSKTGGKRWKAAEVKAWATRVRSI